MQKELNIDVHKLTEQLKKIKTSQTKEPLDPLRGLEGELRRKVLAGLAGHRSGNLTIEETEIINQIQSNYDHLYLKDGNYGSTN